LSRAMRPFSRLDKELQMQSAVPADSSIRPEGEARQQGEDRLQ